MQYYWNKLNFRQLFIDFIIVIVLTIGATWVNFAHATAGGEGDNTSCNGVGNPNSPCAGGNGGNGGNGGSGGSGGNGGNATGGNATGGNATNTNSNVATGGTGIGLGGTGIASAGSTVTTNTNAVANGGKGGNANSNATGGQAKQNQKQAQDQDQNQHQTAESKSNSAVNGSGNGGVSNVAVTQEGNHVAANTASAVPVTIVQSDSCQVGYAMGGQAVSFGLSFSGSKNDENCERIKLWRELRQAGYNKEALLLLMQDDRVAKAFNSGVQDKHVADAFNGNTKKVNNEYEGREVANLR